MPGLIYIVLHCKNMQHYIIYSIPLDLQKTHEWSLTPLSKYTFENSASGQEGGQTN